MQNPTFEIVTTTAGAISIRDNVTREIMHNPVGPWAEANALYIEQSRLKDRLQEGGSEPLVIFDVGLGAAANALAVLHCARHARPHRPLKLISFERDLTLLQFALDHADQFEHFAGFENAIHEILRGGQWSENGVEWELRHGDYAQMIGRETHRANLIFFDPYSPKKNTDMWNTEVFSKTFARCCADQSILFTYSCATPIRVAMLRAGFYVGTGLGSGLKEETTQASTRLSDLDQPLGHAWFGRWERSHSPNAAGAPPEQLAEIQKFMRNHIQFR